jgi:DNA-binding IclR family transcriptional regulator
MLTKVRPGSGTQIQSVGSAARVLLWIASNRWGCTAKEAPTTAGMAIPTVYHLLNTVVVEGLLARDSDQRYGIGPQVGVLAFAYQQQMTVPEYLLHRYGVSQRRRARPPTLRDGARTNDIHLMAVEESKNALRVAWALLRTLTRAQSAKHCLPLRRTNNAVSSVAAPIRQGAVVLGAYGLSVPNERFSRNVDRLTRAIQDAAKSAGRNARGDSCAVVQCTGPLNGSRIGAP